MHATQVSSFQTNFVVSTANVVVESQLVNIKQDIIVPSSPRFSSALGSSAVSGSLCRLLHDIIHC